MIEDEKKALLDLVVPEVPLHPSESLIDVELGLKESYECIAEGISTTYHAVKNIISGMIPERPAVLNEEKERKVVVDKGEEEEEVDFDKIVVTPAPIARLPDDYGVRKEEALKN